ncbi:MAG TPA: FAD-dependent oxidoreductase [Pseudonocardiaceae bacterium]|jgi:D-amino-acid oxidase|nr:FAD-dependent oxidoreductase [Pseudonocardiaceae bacterium]
MTDDVLVVGAGVIGLTTAICLAEAGLRVRVVTATPPRETTSAVAGALWGRGPGVAEPAAMINAWSAVTFIELAALAEDPATGVHFTRGRDVTRESVAAPVAEQARSVVRCLPDELPDGFRDGYWLTVPTVDMPVYLDYLLGRLVAAGAGVVPGVVRHRDDVAGLAPVVVNCTGVAARELVPDNTVRPVRGQHVIVANPGIDEFFVEDSAQPSWVSFFPHGDRVVLGGIAGADDWNLTPDPATTEEIIRRCAAVEPRLAGAPVLANLVGLRPARAEVRVAVEPGDGVRWVHNYGHGGMGVTLSWGCAQDVVQLVTAF